MLYMFSLSFLSIQLIYFQILAMLSYFSQDWGDIVISGVIYQMNKILFPGIFLMDLLEVTENLLYPILWIKRSFN